MGLRKITQNEETTYMYADVSIPEEVMVILLRKESANFVKLSIDNDSVVKWSRNLQKSPKEYVELVQKAVENCFISYGVNEQTEMKEDVFEIQEDCLVWKQYFPDKNVFGRRGRFTIDKMEYHEAVKKVLNGSISDLNSKSSCIQEMTLDLEKNSKELQEARDLAAKCVQEKEDFEKEIYGKCAALINEKKLKIRQLMSGHSSSSEDQGSVARRILDDTQSSRSNTKSVKQGISESDGYSSDTDVDDPDKDDVDTDEENSRKATTQQQKRKSPLKSSAPKRMFDSQDDLFNNSLEAELYSSDNTANKKHKSANAASSDNAREKNSNSINTSTNRKNGRSKQSNSPSHSCDSNTQNSVFNEFLS